MLRLFLGKKPFYALAVLAVVLLWQAAASYYRASRFPAMPREVVGNALYALEDQKQPGVLRTVRKVYESGWGFSSTSETEVELPPRELPHFRGVEPGATATLEDGTKLRVVAIGVHWTKPQELGGDAFSQWYAPDGSPIEAKDVWRMGQARPLSPQRIPAYPLACYEVVVKASTEDLDIAKVEVRHPSTGRLMVTRSELKPQFWAGSDRSAFHLQF